jgi:hypothetical protein
MFRPEMLKPMGFPDDVHVHGWGISLERPTMIKYVVTSALSFLPLRSVSFLLRARGRAVLRHAQIRHQQHPDARGPQGTNRERREGACRALLVVLDVAVIQCYHRGAQMDREVTAVYSICISFSNLRRAVRASADVYTLGQIWRRTRPSRERAGLEPGLVPSVRMHVVLLSSSASARIANTRPRRPLTVARALPECTR